MNPPRNRKGESGSPPPKANASGFYPNPKVNRPLITADCAHANTGLFVIQVTNGGDASSELHGVSLKTISKLLKGASLAFARYFFIAAAPSSCREWIITIPWNPFFASNRATSLLVPFEE